ncbi:GNAT family N-acetyltransferase [Nocardia caishijiensis]|uniref:Ribosomal-protein-alanine N-acetyltransferase n=1 Tax=Nocardia caishijiensis TaxID=184756 RepID=A0ABQ6YKN4_9NOCA|nr:N-acetyltransferase [Nocardia caishijiensis]KAF0846343.1 ribosomal-protein-alanine N-acetyltransferase [Nocardia caishijiensis]
MTTIEETVRYREPTPSDLPDIQLIDGAAFPADRYPFFVLRQLLQADSSRSVVAVEPGNDDEVVGYALTIMGEGSRAWLLSLAVSPDRRGCGYGRGLLARTIALCQEKGDADEIWLTVDPKNVTAYSLFEDVGFVLRVHDETYFGEGQPRDVLVYKLRRISAADHR